MNFTESIKQTFNAVADHLFGQLTGNEELNLNLHAEESTFVRFNNNKVRQNTHVEQRSISLTLQKDRKTSNVAFSITGNLEEDKKRGEQWLAIARQECALLPVDDFQVPMQKIGRAHV